MHAAPASALTILAPIRTGLLFASMPPPALADGRLLPATTM